MVNGKSMHVGPVWGLFIYLHAACGRGVRACVCVVRRRWLDGWNDGLPTWLDSTSGLDNWPGWIPGRVEDAAASPSQGEESRVHALGVRAR